MLCSVAYIQPARVARAQSVSGPLALSASSPLALPDRVARAQSASRLNAPPCADVKKTRFCTILTPVFTHDSEKPQVVDW